jgi:PAS domain S-box-containing protein
MTEATTDYIYTVRIEGGHAVETRHGPGCLAVTGYTEEEFAADPYLWIRMVVAEDRVMVEDHARIVLAGEEDGAIEHRITRKDGTIRWMRNTPVPRMDENGNIQAYDGLIQDITERKEAEENLRKSEEKHRNIINNLQDGYYEVDLAGNITFLNDALCLTFGGSRDEIMGVNYRQYATPESAKEALKVFNELYRTGGRHAKIMRYNIVSKDGAMVPVELDISPIQNAEGRTIGFRGVGRDICERLRLEEEKEKLQEQLNQSQKMEAIGTLAGGIAHDFNNLLMGIQGYTSLMLLKTEQTHPHYDKLKSIEKQVQNGAELTRQLLGFARGGRYDVKAFNINDIITKTAQMFGRTKKEIIIHENLADDLWHADIDQGQIEQMLLNIYVNAWQAMPTGGDLYLETRNVELDEGYSKFHTIVPGRYVKVSITDTGVGMDEKTKERIFEPFFTTRDMRRGTGLGLASVYGIVKGHKGTINVYSERGKGTTFNIYLPISVRKAEGRRKPAVLPVSGTETILVIDDETFILDVTKGLLESMGYQVMTAKSGEEAVDLFALRKDGINLIILDMIMPGLSGEETFERLKEIKPDVRTILASGYSLNGDAARIMEKGCRAFIQKPFALSDLSEKIREVLEQP